MTSTPRRVHSLVVGGTGMLRGVVLHRLALGEVVSVIARRSAGFRPLLAAALGQPGILHPLQLDYRDTRHLRRAVFRVQREHGPIRLTVAWIHSSAPSAAETLAACLARQACPGRYFRIRSSSVTDPTAPDVGIKDLVRRCPSLRYREIILGFRRIHGVSRWLTQEEISAGVVRAIVEDRRRSLVGVVRPWSERPGS